MKRDLILGGLTAEEARLLYEVTGEVDTIETILSLKKMNYPRMNSLTAKDIDTFLEIDPKWITEAIKETKQDLIVDSYVATRLRIDIAFELNFNKGGVSELEVKNLTKGMLDPYLQASRLIADQGTVARAEGSIEGLMKNPALESFWLVDLDWLDSKQTLALLAIGDTGEANAQAMIAQNLYRQHKEINQKNVVEEADRIIAYKEKFRNVHIFSGRNVLFAANAEKADMKEKFGVDNKVEEMYVEKKYGIELEDSVFGKNLLLDQIEKVGGNVPNGIIRSKDHILSDFETTPPPFVSVFHTHGGPGAIYLTGGEMVDREIKEGRGVVKITLEEFCASYKARRKNFKNTGKPEELDVLMFAACDDATFTRPFLDFCEKEGIQKPIIAVTAQHGNPSFVDHTLPYGNSMFQNMFNSGDTLEGLMMFDWDGGSNPSLYIPDEQNRTMQIAQRQEDEVVKLAENEIKSLEDELSMVA